VRRLLAGVASLWLVGCQGADPSVDSDSEAGADPVTWADDLGPLVADRCGGCHAPGGIAVDFSEASAAAAWAEAMVDAVGAGRMPPWAAADQDGCGAPHPLVGDPRLTDEEIALFSAWIEGGRQAGAGAVVWPLPEGRIDADAVLVPAVDFPLQPGLDRVVCTSVEAPAAEDRWLLRAQVVPGDRAVTHHVVLMLDTQGLSQAEPGWFDCFGGVGRSSPVLFWAPGTGPLELPAGSAMRVPAGVGLMVQVHYHTASSPTESALPEVRLDWAASAPEWEAELRLLGNARSAAEGLFPGEDDLGEPEFRIPAGAHRHVEHMQVEVGGPEGVDQRVWSMGHHMHRFGMAMSSAQVVGEERACLLATPDWDFDWRRLYTYDATVAALPVLRHDDRIELRCVYANHLGHPGARQTLTEAGLARPIDVGLGAAALDEMCATLVGVLYPRDQNR
jgi:hypothetical protein